MSRPDRIRPAVGLASALAASALLAGCGLPGSVRGWIQRDAGPPPDLSHGVEVVDEEAVVAFQERMQAFYDRLSRRRFNTFATYKDSVLRDHFRSEEAFYDYYADLAHALDRAAFEKNRAVAAEVTEFAVEAPGRARVQVLLRGDNGEPLRFWDVVLEREDLWERADGTWWVVPGKL